MAKKPVAKKATAKKAAEPAVKTDLPKAAIVRLAKKAGVERVGEDAALAIREAAEAYILKLASESLVLANHAGRKTIKAEDVKLVKL